MRQTEATLKYQSQEQIIVLQRVIIDRKAAGPLRSPAAF